MFKADFMKDILGAGFGSSSVAIELKRFPLFHYSSIFRLNCTKYAFLVNCSKFLTGFGSTGQSVCCSCEIRFNFLYERFRRGMSGAIGSMQTCGRD